MAVLDGLLWLTTQGSGLAGGPTCQGSGVTLMGQRLPGVPKKTVVLDDVRSVDDLVAGGGYLWLADGDGHAVYRIDVRSEMSKRRVERFGVKQGPDRLAFAEGNLWMLDTQTGSLFEMGVSGQPEGNKDVTGKTLTDITVGGGYVWIADPGAGQIIRVPEDLSDAGAPLFPEAVTNGPSAVSYLSSGSLAVGFDDGTLADIDRTSGNPRWTQLTGIRPNAMVSGDGDIYVVGVPASSG